MGDNDEKNPGHVSYDELESLANLRASELYRMTLYMRIKHRHLVDKVNATEPDKRKFQEENLRANLTEIEHLKLLGKIKKLEEDLNTYRFVICGLMIKEEIPAFILGPDTGRRLIEGNWGVKIEMHEGMVAVEKVKIEKSNT